MNVPANGNPPSDSTPTASQEADPVLGPPNANGAVPAEQPDDGAFVANNVDEDVTGLGSTDRPNDVETLDQEENVRHIPGINPKVDMAFYNNLHCVDPKLSDEERAYDDEFLESLTTEKLRSVAGKLSYDIWDGKGRKRKSHRDGVPTSGNKGPLLGKILAYFHFMREEKATDQSREINHGANFDSCEDARLIEIMTDPAIFADICFAFQSGSRADIDRVDGSLVETTWNSVIAGRYFNNFSGYQPPDRHTDPNDVLYSFQPNKTSICRRTATR